MAIAGVLVHLLAAGLPALLADLLPGRVDGAHQLDDDGRRDIGHHIQGEDGHALHGAAGEHVEHAQHALGLALERAVEHIQVDAGDRDVRAQSIDEQSAQGEPQTLMQIGRLLEGADVHIGCKLFRGRGHDGSLML
jgi:hypothetical protein